MLMTKSKKSVVSESGSYDNFVGKKNTAEVPREATLSFLEDTTDLNVKDNHWVGMPEFKQDENPPYKTIYVHFRTKEEFDEFSKMYTRLIDADQKISIKTKSMWYPHLDRDANSLKRWIEE